MKKFFKRGFAALALVGALAVAAPQQANASNGKGYQVRVVVFDEGEKAQVITFDDGTEYWFIYWDDGHVSKFTRNKNGKIVYQA